MDLSIAKSRMDSVIRTDSITTSQGDFLATHVPLRRLQLLHKFDLQPSQGQTSTEEELYRQYVRNPENRHQFITVYGQSGTGKSHLIRWFEARFENDKPENEVVLFIRRSDNTLKGTIRQLLEKPEVQGMANKEIYDRLVRASVSVEPAKLKDLIYHNFIIELANDSGEHYAIQLNNTTKKRLEAFLNNDVVHAKLMETSGPIERMYSKVAENTFVDRDTIAEFTAEDFVVTPDLYEEITSGGGDQKAQRMARKLMADEEGLEAAREIADYLNQFVNDVIQRCAGIEPGDFRQIFKEIRCELYKQGKNLSLFIEDVTSFTGVDDALLDALIVEHTGMNTNAEMCRISSIVGTTSSYLQNNFRDNHKDRITALIYIPSDVFDENGVYEFVGRYLNAMSLSEQQIQAWLKNGALPSEYPIHTTMEGRLWESVAIDHMQLNLYPFSKASIIYLYRNNLAKGHQTPRYMINSMIRPVMNDILNNPTQFPSNFCPLIGVNNALSFQIHSQIKDTALAGRMLRFLTIWGNGKPDRVTDGTDTFFAGIKESILTELGFPLLSGAATVMQPQTDSQTISSPSSAHVLKSQSANEVSQETQGKMASAHDMLTEWINGKTIDISATGGTIGILNKAHKNLNDYLRSAINWLAEGVSPDDVAKALSGSRTILVLERQSKGTGYYTLPATWESMNLLEVMIRWQEYGKESWNYLDADFDLYLLSSWTARVKNDIVCAVEEDRTKRTPYIEAAMVAGIYQLILTGVYGEKSLKNLTSDYLFRDVTKTVKNSCHSNEWIRLCDLISQRGADANNRETVRRYFNLPQGDRGSKIVLDEPRLSSVFRKIKANKLAVPAEDLGLKDLSAQRQAPYRLLKDIIDRIDNVAQTEVAKAKPTMAQIATAFDLADDELLDEDMLADLVNDVTSFYNEVNVNHINIQVVSPDGVKKAAKQIVKAYKDISSVLTTSDSLTILMAFSGDPNAALQSLVSLLNRLDTDIKKANQLIESRLAPFTNTSDNSQADQPYSDCMDRITQARVLWEGEYIHE